MYDIRRNFKNDCVFFSFSNKIGGAKGKLRNGGIDEDDGDYATLRELPLAPVVQESGDDTTSEEGKVSAP